MEGMELALIQAELPRRIVPPIPTLLDGRGLAVAHQRAMLDRLCEAGVDGVLTLGTVGEGAVLDDDVRRAAVATAVEAMGDRSVVVGCSGQTADAIVAQIEAAAGLGAAAALVLPPFYFQLSQEALVRLFSEIASRSSLPVMLYHIPGMTGNPFEIDTVQRLAEHPGVVGIKDSGGDFVRFLQLHRLLSSDDFVVFQGVAPLIGPSLLAGCDDTMCTVTALFPKPEMRLRAAIEASDLATVASLMRHISQITELFRLGSHPIPANVKAIIQLLGMGPGRPHEPAITPDETHRDRLAVGLRQLGLMEGGATS